MYVQPTRCRLRVELITDIILPHPMVILPWHIRHLTTHRVCSFKFITLTRMVLDNICCVLWILLLQMIAQVVFPCIWEETTLWNFQRFCHFRLIFISLESYSEINILYCMFIYSYIYIYIYIYKYKNIICKYIYICIYLIGFVIVLTIF